MVKKKDIKDIEKSETEAQGNESIDLTDVDALSKYFGYNMVLQSGEVGYVKIEGIEEIEIETVDGFRKRYRISGMVRKEGEEWEKGWFFAGKKLMRQILTEARNKGFKTLRGKEIKVKRIGTGINTQWLLLDLR